MPYSMYSRSMKVLGARGLRLHGVSGLKSADRSDPLRMQAVSEDAPGADDVLRLEQVLALLHQDLADHRELLADGAGVALHGDGGGRFGQHDVGVEPEFGGGRVADVLGEEVDVRVRIELRLVHAPGRELRSSLQEGVPADEAVDGAARCT